jgi:hypothetical protein
MAHIDFGKAFEEGATKTAAPSIRLSQQSREPGPENVYVRAKLARFRPARLGRADSVNIIFVVITVLGGLLCAFYFFNGGELIQSVAAWPTEFLYPQPSEGQQDPQDDVGRPGSLAGGLEGPTGGGGRAAGGRGHASDHGGGQH